MDKILQRLGPKFEEIPIQESLFVKPASILYDIDGKSTAKRLWSSAAAAVKQNHGTLYSLTPCQAEGLHASVTCPDNPPAWNVYLKQAQ